MVQTSLFLLVLVLIIALIWVRRTLSIWRRKRLNNKHFPSHWVTILEQNIPFYKGLSASLRRQLHGHINVLLEEKKFKGCGGLPIADEIRVTIAAQAGLLLLNERGNYYSKLHLILVYPSAFIANQNTSLGEQYLEGKQFKIGESWRTGIVVLSWKNIRYDIKNWQDGHNVVLHEFAHQLDQEDGRADGVPMLEKRSDYAVWGRVFRKEYENLILEVEQGWETVIDEYGATDPAEFFAVATETFFEKPKQMKNQHSALYNQLKRYYKSDPVEWI